MVSLYGCLPPWTSSDGKTDEGICNKLNPKNSTLISTAQLMAEDLISGHFVSPCRQVGHIKKAHKYINTYKEII